MTHFFAGTYIRKSSNYAYAVPEEWGQPPATEYDFHVDGQHLSGQQTSSKYGSSSAVKPIEADNLSVRLAAAAEDIRNGHYKDFHSMEDFLISLDEPLDE